MTSQEANQLTEQKFWENYWHSLTLPSIVDESFSFDRCLKSRLLARLKDLAPANQHGVRRSVFEVGAAPGKWLTLFPQEEYAVAGIEYTEKGMIALRKNMELLEISPLELIQGDFFNVEPRPDYDVVMSLGFIEHFDDPVPVIARHAAWLRPGGLLVLGVPNFTGFHGLMQSMLDRTILRAHNTSIMNLDFFRKTAPALGMHLETSEYLGSFEPALPLTYQPRSWRNIFPKAILRCASYIRKWRRLDNINSPFLSSYILTIYRKTS